jgi:quinol monooxygenase YgiN
MAEVRVIARFVARKGKKDQLRVLLQSMLGPTHAEPGCKAYELYESDSNGRFYLYERWESQATLDQHAASPHFNWPVLTPFASQDRNCCLVPLTSTGLHPRPSNGVIA